MRAIERWPPPNSKGGRWAKKVQRIGKRWRSAAIDGEAPSEVAALWTRIIHGRELKLNQIRKSRSMKEQSNVDDLIHALVEIVALADEACVGVGIPDENGKAGDLFEQIANDPLPNGIMEAYGIFDGLRGFSDSIGSSTF